MLHYFAKKHRQKKAGATYYKGFLDLEEELEQYKKLCLYKYCDYKNYTEWKDHIVERLRDANQSRETLINYQHYIILLKRNHESLSSTLIDLLMLLVVVDAILEVRDLIGIIVLISGTVIIALFFLIFKRKIDLEAEFYEDIITIIEENIDKIVKVEQKSTDIES